MEGGREQEREGETKTDREGEGWKEGESIVIRQQVAVESRDSRLDKGNSTSL